MRPELVLLGIWGVGLGFTLAAMSQEPQSPGVITRVEVMVTEGQGSGTQPPDMVRLNGTTYAFLGGKMPYGFYYTDPTGRTWQAVFSGSTVVGFQPV